MPSTPKHDPARAARQLRDYLAKQPPGARATLERMRDAIRATAPGAVEVFSYGIPGFRLDGQPLLWYAAWKQHTSLYPVGEALREALGTELDGVSYSKGTIRFPIEAPPSVALIRQLTRARMAQIRALAEQ